MTYLTERKTLAINLAKTQTGSEHSPLEIERVLAAFIDPLNTKMSLPNFFKLLTDTAIGNGDECNSAAEDASLQALMNIFDRVRNARLFDATYLGHMLSEASIPGMLAYILALRIGSNTVAREVSEFESQLDLDAIRGLLEIVGFDPSKGSGTFTSGGTMAMMTVLAVARKILEIEYAVKNVDFPTKVRVLTSPFAHYSIEKICDLLSGPGQQIELVKVEPYEFRMSIDDLGAKIAESEANNIPIMAIVAIAGETETGLVDNLEQIAKIAETKKLLWVVDGAFGAPYRISRAHDKFVGLERAFAVTLDPHKALYTPYSNGAALFRDAEEHACMTYKKQGVIKAPYTQFAENLPEIIKNIKTGQGSLGQKRIEGSMGAGPILSTLAVLNTLGNKGLEILYDLTLDRIEYLYNRLQNSVMLEPIHRPDLNLLCFKLRSPIQYELGLESHNQVEKFVKNIKEELDGSKRGEKRYFFSTTDLPFNLQESIWVWRACIMNPRTTNEILEEAVTSFEALITDKLNAVHASKQSTRQNVP
jgi:L-2,4-diaminobutyrate decarboxylase